MSGAEGVSFRAAPLPFPPSGPKRWLLALDAARQLGVRPCVLYLWAQLRRRLGVTARALGALPLPCGPLLPVAAKPAALPGDPCALAQAASPPGDWHGTFSATTPAVLLDLFAPGDIRPLWEHHRLAALPWLVMAARLRPGGGDLAQAETLLRAWCALNPPFFGPAWACGQEAALRAMHLCLALALLDAPPLPAMRALLLAHRRRIEAERAYALAQDNNHPISEAAGLLVIGLTLGDRALVVRAGRALARCCARLIAPCGAFAQASPAYHRLLLDTISLAEWFRRRHGAPPLPAPFAERAAAATLWLHRLVEPSSGALPRCGAGDDSAFADLSLAGPDDARASVERAARLFLGATADAPADPGCLWLGLVQPSQRLGRGGAWRSAGWMGEEGDGLRLLLRTAAPLRFRPAHCDLLHFEMWADGKPLLPDGGSGAYNPPPQRGWWLTALWGSAGHNVLSFDGEEQMPRLSRFLLAHWPRCEALCDGARLTDRRGRIQERRFRRRGRVVEIEDRLYGPFTHALLRWRLAPDGGWRLLADGVAGRRARLRVLGNAALALRLGEGWFSPRYGEVKPLPVLEVIAPSSLSRVVTVVEVA